MAFAADPAVRTFVEQLEMSALALEDYGISVAMVSPVPFHAQISARSNWSVAQNNFLEYSSVYRNNTHL